MAQKPRNVSAGMRGPMQFWYVIPDLQGHDTSRLDPNGRSGTNSAGIFSFQHGTLYPILHRLEADGQLRGEWSGDGRRRKTYRITAAGQTTLREGAEDLERQFAVLLELLGGANAA